MQLGTEKEKVTWFSMWFLASVATFCVTFFPMFYRLMDNRNKHFNRQAELEKHIADYVLVRGKKVHPSRSGVDEMNAKAWAVSIVLIVPAFIIIYCLSKDLLEHELNQDVFLANAFAEKMFMPQTIPIKKYALITIVTLGLGGIYWLYKVINLYNAHFKAQWKVEEKIAKLMGEDVVGESM